VIDKESLNIKMVEKALIDASATNVVAVAARRRHLLESLRRKPYQVSCSS
jgi:hypothetical protein